MLLYGPVVKDDILNPLDKLCEAVSLTHSRMQHLILSNYLTFLKFIQKARHQPLNITQYLQSIPHSAHVRHFCNLLCPFLGEDLQLEIDIARHEMSKC